MTPAAVAALGRDLWAAWDAHRRLPTRGEGGMPATIAEGYAVQAALVQASGLPQCGWKIGATNRAAQTRLNLPGPLYGRLLAPFVRSSPTVFGAEFAIRALEPEVALRLSADLPPRDRPWTRGEVASAVAELCPALEVPDARWLDWDSLGAAAFIADNGAAGRLVLGPPCAGWSGLDLAAVPVRLLLGDAVVAEGSTGDVLGHPLDALAWLANALNADGLRLRAGDLVTTGTCTPIGFAEPGDRVVADLGPLGRAEAAFD